jgi:hypothetical protein
LGLNDPAVCGVKTVCGFHRKMTESQMPRKKPYPIGDVEASKYYGKQRKNLKSFHAVVICGRSMGDMVIYGSHSAILEANLSKPMRPLSRFASLLHVVDKRAFQRLLIFAITLLDWR